MAKEALAIFALDDNLFYGRIVYTHGHTLYAVILIGYFLFASSIGVIVFIATKEI